MKLNPLKARQPQKEKIVIKSKQWIEIQEETIDTDNTSFQEMIFAAAKIKHPFECFCLPSSDTVAGLGCTLPNQAYKKPCFMSPLPKTFCVIFVKQIYLSILQGDGLFLPGVFKRNILTITGHLASSGDKDLLHTKDTMSI